MKKIDGVVRRMTLNVPLAIVLLSIWLAACGSSGVRDSARTSSNASYSGAGTVTIATPGDSSEHYLNDGDKDRIYDEEAPGYRDNNRDNDNDPSEDYQRDDNGDYHDRDDMPIADFGRPAGPADEQAILSFVRRYYAAALAEDGTAACSMLPPGIASTVPKDYGGDGTAGPPYLRGAKTCSDVMRLLFKHARSEFMGRFVLTGVRIGGDRAYALLGSIDRPASYMGLERLGGMWRVAGLIGGPMP